MGSLRPNGDGSKTLRLVAPNPANPPEPPPPKPPELPRIVRLLNLAREWQAKIDRGELGTRADIAKRSGLSGPRVCAILALLKLHPVILEHIDRLEPGAPERHLTERLLRPITRLPQAEQLRVLEGRLRLDVRSAG